MSDAGRKDLNISLKEKLTPQIMKSDVEKAKEHTTGNADKVARFVFTTFSCDTVIS